MMTAETQRHGEYTFKVVFAEVSGAAKACYAWVAIEGVEHEISIPLSYSKDFAEYCNLLTLCSRAVKHGLTFRATGTLHLDRDGGWLELENQYMTREDLGNLLVR